MRKVGVTLAGLLVFLVFVGVATLCIHRDNEEEANLMRNRDPRVGPVYDRYERPRTSKVCDGRNLVYRSGVRGGTSISVSPNDPQCAR